MFRGGSEGLRLRLWITGSFSFTSLLGIALAFLLVRSMMPYGSAEVIACAPLALPILFADGLVQFWFNERLLRPVHTLFDHPQREEAPRALRILALRGLIGFPLRGAVASLVIWELSTGVFALGSLFVPALAHSDFITYGAQALVGVGLIAFVFQYHIFKLFLHRPLRELAPTLKGVPLGPVLQLPIRWKLSGALFLLVSVAVYLSGLVGVAHARQRALAQVATLGRNLLQVLPAGSRAAPAAGGARLVRVDPATGRIEGEEDSTLPAELRAPLQSGAEATLIDPAGGRFVVLAPRGPESSGGLREAALLPWTSFRRGISGIRWVSAILMLFAWGITLSIAYLLSQDVSRPLEQMVQRAGEVARGDLRGSIWRLSEDEAGDLADGFRTLVGRVRALVRTTHEAVECLEGARSSLARVGKEVRIQGADREALGREILGEAQAIEEGIRRLAEFVQAWLDQGNRIAVGGRTIRTRLEELVGLADRLGRSVKRTVGSLQVLSESVEGVGGQSEELSQTSRHTGAVLGELGQALRSHRELAGRAADAAAEVRARAESSRAQVQKAVQAVQSVADQAQQTGRVLEELRGRVQEIGRVLEFLDDISEEAHMLSINAAILSRQVSAGRQVGVVAQEIKQLVQKSRGEAKQIARLILEVTREARETAEAMQVAGRQVREGTVVARDADESIRRIVERADRGALRMRATAEAAARAEQSAESAIAGYGEVAQRLNRLSEEAAGERAIAERLREAAATMEGTAGGVLSLLRGQVPSAASLARSTENVLEMVRYVHQVMQRQQEPGHGLERVLDGLQQAGAATDEAGRALSSAVEVLGEQVAALARESARFQL